MLFAVASAEQTQSFFEVVSRDGGVAPADSDGPKYPMGFSVIEMETCSNSAGCRRQKARILLSGLPLAGKLYVIRNIGIPG